jgi:di/tricarboxylate transporter
MTERGAAARLGELLVGPLVALSTAPLVLLALLIVAVAVVHLAITNLAACMALLIPIAITIATAAGLIRCSAAWW